jgi:hypothetical protein
MRPKQTLLVPLISILLLCFPSFSHAQSWSGVLDPSRAADWSGAGIPGGIPSRSSICATLSPGASASQINSAISSCAANQVVYLNAGTYNLSDGIVFNGKNNVTLRGAGPTQTILQFTGGSSCGGQGADVCAINSSPLYVGSSQIAPGGSATANWTAGYARGTTQITLSSVGNLAVGDLLVLEQANDTADTGGAFICSTQGVCRTDSGNQNGEVISGVTYSQNQLVTVTAINGNVVTISSPLYMSNWRASQSPRAWWMVPVTGDGIEDMTIDNSNSPSSIAAGVMFYDCYQCWLKNVKSLNGNRDHVWIYQSAHVVVRDSYFYGTHNAAQESYGVETFISGDSLIENNILEAVAAPFMGNSGSGDVFGYNYTTNNLYTPSANWMESSFASHNAGNEMTLYEGNDADGISCDDEWGTSAAITEFRNRLHGWATGKSINTNVLHLMSFCRDFNIVGNVIGTAGYHTKYESSPQTSSSSCDTSLYQLGYAGNECGGGGLANDPLVRSSLLRWGNYDTVNGSVQWNVAEIPVTALPYIAANLVPGSHTLADSWYLSARPSWWATPFGTPAWPPIGPDVTGGNQSGTGGFANNIPAVLCYNNTQKDSSGILDFDGDNCYGSGSASSPSPTPDPPTNLNVVVK